MRPLVFRILKLSYAALFVIILLIMIVPHSVLRIYTNIPEIIAASFTSLWVMCSSYLFTAPANIFFCAVSGTGNTRTAFLLELCSLFVYMAYCYLIMRIIRADVAICWTAEHVYAIIMMLLCGWYLHNGKWKHRKI